MRRGPIWISAVALALACAICAPAGALAAPPANDAFAAPQALPGPLPIAAAGSNVEATEEPGEPGHGGVFDFEPAGHSVWFSWEATASEWVTIATCGSSFDTLLDVYTGSGLFGLVKVALGREGANFGCGPGGNQVTFPAVAETTYTLRVDGNLSPQPPATTEGAIALQIAPTPAPANDAFAAAQPVVAESLEGGGFYRVDVPGFNWNATKEAGEPLHGGDAGGASTWFSWTAPVSGEASVRAVGGALSPLLGVYTGDSVAALDPVGTPAFGPGAVDVDVTAGTAYRIAVDGLLDGGSGLPSMGQFTFLIYLEPSAVAPRETGGPGGGPPPPPPDVVAPGTTILGTKIKAARRSATFRFGSSEAASFRCKLDRRKAAACGSPKSYARLAPGAHTFRVYAIDAAGNADATPAVARFAITPPKSRHSRGSGH